MKEWQKKLYIYRLSPAPPKKDDRQGYIDLYLAEKEEKYLSWFLHYYEPTLNTTVMGVLQRYSMFGHFLDIKEACVLGILRALEKYPSNSDTPFITYKTRIMWEEIHNYIRTMRTGFTVQSDDEYQNLRNIMRVYAAYNSKNDPETLQIISEEVGLSEKTVKEILRSGFHNMQFVDFTAVMPPRTAKKAERMSLAIIPLSLVKNFYGRKSRKRYSVHLMSFLTVSVRSYAPTSVSVPIAIA